jgi:hypothetical protein
MLPAWNEHDVNFQEYSRHHLFVHLLQGHDLPAKEWSSHIYPSIHHNHLTTRYPTTTIQTQLFNHNFDHSYPTTAIQLQLSYHSHPATNITIQSQPCNWHHPTSCNRPATTIKQQTAHHKYLFTIIQPELSKHRTSLKPANHDLPAMTIRLSKH